MMLLLWIDVVIGIMGRLMQLLEEDLKKDLDVVIAVARIVQ